MADDDRPDQGDGEQAGRPPAGAGPDGAGRFARADTGAFAARGASSAARNAAAERAARRDDSGARHGGGGNGAGGTGGGGNGGGDAGGGATTIIGSGAADSTQEMEPTTRTATATATRPAEQDKKAEPSGRPEDDYTVELPPPRPKRPWDPITNQFIFFGDFLLFTVRSLAYVPLVFTRYRKEYVRLIGEVTFGSKALAVLASTVMVAGVLSAVVGVQLALEGYQGLDVIGLGPLAGYLSAFANTRELTPLLTGFGLAAQMGCRFTSELGAMSVTDEIAALEVMSVPSQAFLVTTRIMAALTVTIPLFLLSLAGSYLATQITVVAVAHQGSGTYLHYFHEFLAPKDIILATLKVFVFAIFITVIHCFYGYTTTGGPENVGRSTGRAIRASIVMIAVTDMLMTILFWGTSSGIKITG
jgi:phospholipid/cholesterol/gamma-HCH transport system permease protein